MNPAAPFRRLIAAQPALAAAALMVAASAVIAAMHGGVRWIAADLHPFVIAFWRNLFGFLFFAPWFIRGGLRFFHTRRFGTHVVRAGFNATSMMLLFLALSLVPLAEVTALSLTSPLFVAIGGMVFFGETVRAARWVALALGIIGALLILRPGFETLQTGMLCALGSAAVASGSKLIAKGLTRTDSPATVSAYVAMLMTPITLVAALFVWRWPSAGELAALAGIGALASLGHLCFVKAYSIADISFAEPVVFTRLVFAALFGLLVFAEFPDVWTWAGAAMIVSATSLIAHRERARRQRASRPAARPAE